MKNIMNFAIKPPKKVNIEGFDFDIYIRTPSYLVFADANSTYDSHRRNLIFIKGCVTNEHGIPLFEDLTVEELGNKFPYQIIGAVASSIYENSSEYSLNDEVVKK